MSNNLQPNAAIFDEIKLLRFASVFLDYKIVVSVIRQLIYRLFYNFAIQRNLAR
jgi:hypothetical protein